MKTLLQFNKFVSLFSIGILLIVNSTKLSAQTEIYFQDFETNSDWTFTQPTIGNNNNYWVYGSGTAGATTGAATLSGTRSLQIWRRASNAWQSSYGAHTTNGYSRTASKVFDFSAYGGQFITFSFWVLVNGEANFDDLRVVVNGTVLDGPLANILAWQQRQIDLTAYAGLNNVTVAFEWRNDGSVQNQPAARLDDIRVVVSAPQAPSCAASPTAPLDEATNVGLTQQLSWPAVSGATGYDVYFGTSNPATTLVSSNQPGTTFNPGTLNASTTYFWRIVPRNTAGSASGCATWSFTTGLAGCLNVPNGLWPSGTYTPACNGTPETITTAGWTGEYSNVNLTSGTQYTFSSSVSTDYITISNSTGTAILASGTSPLTWTSNVTGTVRFNLHNDVSCATQQLNRTRFVQCGTPPPPGPCIQPTPYLTVNAPTTTTPLTISTCTLAGEYNTINNVVSGQTYEFSSSVGSDWLTLTDGSNNPLEFGTSPITWTATFSGTVRLHVSSGSNCATQNACRSTTVTCTSCAPPCPVPSNNTCASAPILNLGVNNNQTHLGTGCGSTATIPGTTDKEVWVAFTVPCGGMNISIDFCGSTPVHNDAYINIFPDCSLNTSTVANNWNLTSCGDGNIRLFWNNVPEGTYYYPIYIAPTWETNYVLNISGTPLYTPAVAPTSISGTTAVCADQSTTLTLQGGSAGTNGVAQWFAGSCGSTVIGTGNSITVSPTVNTSYFVRYSGSCNTTTCASSTITVNNPTLATPPASGDMVWRGASSNDWATLPNWWQYNGTSYAAASAAPTSAQNVIIPANQACVLNQPNTNANAGNAKNLRIESGATLTMTTGSLTVTENWVNNGTFTPGTGTVSFTGSGTHTISGISGAHNFHNLTMNKVGEVQLSVPIAMIGALTLTNGRLNIGNFNLDLPTNTITGGNANSYVRTPGTGVLMRNVGPLTSTVNFPVGRSAYNPASLSNAGTLDKFNVRVIDNVTDDGTAIGTTTSMAVVNRTWMINEQVAGGSNVTLRLQWNSGLPEEINNFAEISSFVAHFIAGEGLWDNIGGTVQSSGVIQTSGITSFSPFTVSSDNAFAPLPVELIAFTAHCQNEDVEVKWSTASEFNSQHYVLQVSEDGYSWSDLYVIEAAGFSTTVLEYSYIHKNAARTKKYYRLRQYDNDGTVETYNTIMSNCTSDEYVFMTFPNPSADAFTVLVLVNDKLLSGSNVLNISDASGKLIYSIALDLENGSGSFEVEGLNLSAGLYYLQLNNGSYASRIIKHSFR
jgi:hypothetical protein